MINSFINASSTIDDYLLALRELGVQSLTASEFIAVDGIAQRPYALTAAPKDPETKGLRGNKPRNYA